MAQIMRLYNSYLGPASDTGIDLGATNFRWKNLYLQGSLNVSQLSSFTNMTVSGSALLNGIVRVGTGNVIKAIISATAAMNFGVITASSSVDSGMVLVGATTFDTCMMGIPNQAISGGSNCQNLFFTAWVASNDAVNIRATNNHSVVSADPANDTFRVTIIKVV